MYFKQERVQKYARDLKTLIYREHIKINEVYVKEGDFSSREEAELHESPWRTYRTGDYWGGKDKYYWFRFTIRIPEHFKGKVTALYLSTGLEDEYTLINPQFLMYVNDTINQGLDINHREVILDKSPAGGETYHIDLKAHSGMMERKVDLVIKLVAIDEALRDFYYNITVPLEVASCLEKEDQRRILILDYLNQAVNMIDMRQPFSESFDASICKANAFLMEEFYEKQCGKEEIEASIIGHTHIDVAWLWTIYQTRQKVARSFSTVLKLMEEDPEYKFMSSQPQLYKYLKEDHPQLYNQVKERVNEGRWEAEGAMWVEPDCNLTSGESLIRQLLHGTQFFREEFGVKNDILWLPDVFGYSANLPQILIGSGIKYFMTSKISWNQFNKVPYDTFRWQGIDGSEILTHFITTKDLTQTLNPHFTTYNGFLYPEAVMGGWDRYQQKEYNKDILIAFGYGDGGGGPTKEMLENHKRMSYGIPGCPKTKMTTAKEFFVNLEETMKQECPKWVGELYLEYHRGTYTSMARNKRDNRKCEILYTDAEQLALLAELVGGQDYPASLLKEGWEIVLRNQFHDILPGSSIKEVYEDSNEEYMKALSIAEGIIDDSLKVILEPLATGKNSVIVYNTLSFERSDIVAVELPETYAMKGIAFESEEGEKLPCQCSVVNGRWVAYFYANNLPPHGYKIYKIVKVDSLSETESIMETNRVETSFFTLDIDSKGTLTSVYDKRNNRELIKRNQRGNKLLAYEDKPMGNDNWDIDIYYKEKMWEIDDVVHISVTENGPVKSVIEIEKRFMQSTIIQKIILYENVPRIDFDTYIDWKQADILLKATFPIDVNTNKATYEIQYGNVERPTHFNTSWDIARFEVASQRWADLSEDGFGVSLLNDSKYGHDIIGQDMSLTLLTSGTYPNPDADKEEHHFTYSLYPHSQDWRRSQTIQMAAMLNNPVYAVVGKGVEATIPKAHSYFNLDKENVFIEVIKKSEDDKAIIIRMYEGYNRRTSVKISCWRNIKQVYECNHLEEEKRKLSHSQQSFEIEFKPYEIKTFKIYLD